MNAPRSFGIFIVESFTMTILPTWFANPGRNGEEYSSRYCRDPSVPKGLRMSTCDGARKVVTATSAECTLLPPMLKPDLVSGWSVVRCRD